MNILIFCSLCVYIVSQVVAVQQLSLPYTCTTTVCKPEKESSASSEIHHTQIHRGPPGKRGVIGQKGDKGDPCPCDASHEQGMKDLRNEWKKEISEFNDVIARLERLENLTKNLPTSVQEMTPKESEEDKDALDISRDADGWIVIQRRKDGSVDFYRDWESYAKGFGNREGEFWLGLRKIHKLTSTKSCKLRIDMTGWDGNKAHAEYTTFRVANEESNFRLAVSGYTGHLSDAMKVHNGQGFSTSDRDNDSHSTQHCAQNYKGPWWHVNCLHSNLNGAYCKSAEVDPTAVYWMGMSSCIRVVEMKVFCS